MELISHHQPEEFRKGLKETQRVRPLPRIPLASIHLGWVMRAPPGKTELERLAKDHPETNPITIKPNIASHAAEQFSWVPLPYCSPPRCPFPIKSLALSAHVSPRTIHFRVLNKSPVSGPGRDPPSCNRKTEGEAETPILWPPDTKSWLIRKTLRLGKIEGRRGRGQQRMRW